MGQRPQRGCLPYIAKWTIGLSFCLSIFSSAAGHCRVNMCSHEFSNAVEFHKVNRGPSYHYCTVLHSYNKCIDATARNCRGLLEFHSISSMVLNWMKDFNCSHVIAQGPGDHNRGGTTNDHRKHRNKPSVPDECVYQGHVGNFSHCIVFGDPHLKTFLNEFQTCRAHGAWPLIDNPYIAVQVTNEKIHKETGATAISKITVIIRDHSPCTLERTYEAQSNDLPGYFVDGNRGGGPDRHVRIKEEDPGKHVEIIIRHITTRIIIRQIGQYLTFAIRMPKEVAMLGSSGDSLELCAKGCPKREIIDPNELLAKPLKQWSTGIYDLREAEEACRHYNLTGFYFYSCVFDLLTTGDNTFSLAAKQAMKDTLSLSPIHGHTFGDNRTYFVIKDKGASEFVSTENSAPGRPCLSVSTITGFIYLIFWLSL